jgi:PadR family transcriptional regulator
MAPAPSPLGSFEEQVLLSILHASDDAYGMRVRQELEEVTGRDVAIGAVYATLDRLEAKGLVDSRRRMEDGLSRRRFVVTRPGLRSLADTRAMRDRLWRGVDLSRLLAAAR